MFVKIAKHRHFDCLRIIRDRKKWNLHQAGFDGFDQAKIADDPLEKGIRLVPVAGEIIRSRAEVINIAHLEPKRDLPKAGEPDSGTFVFSVGIFTLGGAVIRNRQVTVVRLIVEDQQARITLELLEDSPDDLGHVFFCFGLFPIPTYFAVGRRPLVALERAWLKCVVVDDGNLGVELPHFHSSCGRDKKTRVVIVGGVEALAAVNAEGPEPIANGDTGRNQKEIVGETDVVSVFEPIEEMIDDQGAHHDGLPRAGGHFEGDAGRLAVWA